MTGDSTDKPSSGERPRRGSRREPTVLDLTAESSRVEPARDGPAPGDPATNEPVRSELETHEPSRGELPARDTVRTAPADSVAAGPEPEPANVHGLSEVGHGHAVATEAAHHVAVTPESPSGPATEAVAEPAPALDAPLPPEAHATAEAPGEPDGSLPEAEPVASVADAAAAAERPPEEPRPAVVVPPAPRRPGLLGPALTGLAAGFVGAGLLTTGLLMIGPAGDIADRLAGLENAVGERASRRTVEALEKRGAGLESTTAGLRGDLDALAKQVQAIPAGDIGPLLGRVDRVERNLADLAARPVPQPADKAAPAAPPPPQPPPLVAARESAVLAIALLMRDSLLRGAPYQRELEALAAAGVEGGAVDALKPFAATGAPRPPALAADFAPIAALIANPPPPPAHTMTDRISATFAGLFKVRPVGEVSGDSPAALAARAEALLQKGALADAAAAIGRIPPADGAPAAAFRQTLEARIAADAAAASILSKAVDELLAAARLHGGPAR